MNRLCHIFKKKLELNGLEAPDELQMNTMTQHATQQNSEKPKPTCNHCKKPGHYRNQCRQLKREKDKTRSNTNSADNNNNKNSVQLSCNSNNKISNNTNANNTNYQKDRRSRPVYPPCETCGKTSHSTEKCYFGANVANRLPPRNRRPEGQNQVQQTNAQSNSDGNFQAAAQTIYSKRHVLTLALHVTDRSQLKYQNFHQFPRLTGSNPQIQLKSNLDNSNNDSTRYCTQETPKTTVASQTSQLTGIQPQTYVIAKEQSRATQTGKEPLPFISCSKSCPSDIQESQKHKLTTLNGGTIILLLTITTPLIEERLVRDEQTNELYLPVTSMVLLKRKQEILNVPLDFENNLKVGALVDSRAYVSAIARND